MLILIAGLPGSGKTSLAQAISKKLNARHFHSDQIRRELGLWGHYQPEDKAAVYNELLTCTRQALLKGETVVVDSTFYLASLRQPFNLVAEQMGLRKIWVLATAPDNVLRQRVSKLREDSEANLVVLENIKAVFEPLESPYLTIDTSKANAEALALGVIEQVKNGEKTGVGHP
jgi:predicted kinase